MTLSTRLFGLLFGLPARDGRVTEVHRDLPVPGGDGTDLLTDHYAPPTPRGGLPVVLVRTPYDRAGTDPLARVLAERGHHVVVQSCRGTFGSSGEFVPFFGEADDGRALADWVLAQPWSTGRLAVLGGSYFAYTALALVAGVTEGTPIVASARAVTAADFRRAVIWPRGAFGLGTGLTWITALRHQEESPLRLLLLQKRLATLVHRAATRPLAEADRAVGAPWKSYQDWYAHGPEDPWWDQLDLRPALDRLPPEVQIAGWYDLFLDEQLVDHAALVAAGRPVRLVIGPWTHGAFASQGALLRESLARFAGAPASGVRIRVGGTRGWRELPAWPPPSRTAVWALGADGTLTAGPVPSRTGSVRFRHDPDRPAPAAGGRSLLPADAGRRSQRARERRSDVVVFTSAPRRRALEIAGSTVVVLAVPPGSTGHWVARLCDVDRFGVSRNVTDGLLVVEDAGTEEVRIRLAPTAYRFAPGHRIRVQVAAALHPTWAAQSAPAGPSERTLLISSARPSQVRLPVVRDGEDRPARQP